MSATGIDGITYVATGLLTNNTTNNSNYFGNANNSVYYFTTVNYFTNNYAIYFDN
jgi:hypothetical protein